MVIAGIVQFGLGLAKAGVLGYFFPSAAVKVMLSGIGLLIILKQIPHALGREHLVDVPVASNFAELASLFAGPDWSQLNNPAVYITAITLAVVASLETLTRHGSSLIKQLKPRKEYSLVYTH